MPFLKIWIHFVWTTKNQEPFLTKQIRQQVFNRFRQNAKEKGTYVDSINDPTDPFHCFISLNMNQNIAKIRQLVKGESVFWINKNNLCPGKLEWQEEYFAVPVSKSMIAKVRNCIKNQEKHHQLKSFEEEHNLK